MLRKNNSKSGRAIIQRLIPCAAIKKFFNCFGVEIIRKKNIPSVTLLGLKNMPVRTIIDIGANRGQFARYISKVFPTAKILCFEPLPDPYAELQNWVDYQGGRVVAMNVALGAENRDVIMVMHEEHSPSSSILHTTEISDKLYPQTRKQRKIQIQQKTLDDVLRDNDLESLVLIKMDVQDYEDRVIAGGRNIFAKIHACITEICLDILYQGQATFHDLSNYLSSLGYFYCGNIDQKYGDDGHCIYLDALFVRKLP